MKRLFVLLLLAIMVLTMFPRTAHAAQYLYQWTLSNDYTKVTVGGKEYQNYVIIYRAGDKIWIQHVADSYLLDATQQNRYSPDEYMPTLKQKTIDIIRDMARLYPTKELMYINYQPWQRTEFRQDYIDALVLAKGYDRYTTDLFIADENKIGYNNKILGGQLTLAEAKAQVPIANLPLFTLRKWFNKTKSEFDKDVNLYINQNSEVSLGKFGDFLSSIKTSLPDPKPAPYTEVTLYMNDSTIYVDRSGTVNSVVLDAGPICPKDKTYIPLRGVLEAIGATVSYNEASKGVTVKMGDKKVTMTVGSQFVNVGWTSIKLDEPIFTVNGRTMIPLRFVAENLGCEVIWAKEFPNRVIIRAKD